jgi:MOB kinase activator 1
MCFPSLLLLLHLFILLSIATVCVCTVSFQYRWADGVKVKKPVEVSAPEYVDLLLTWVESQLNDEAIFPIQIGGTFPKNFQNVVKTIFKRYFRVYAHIYHSHFPRIARVGAGNYLLCHIMSPLTPNNRMCAYDAYCGCVEAHLNTCFKHFLAFVNEFKLIEAKELEPLAEVIANMNGRRVSYPPFSPQFQLVVTDIFDIGSCKG